MFERNISFVSLHVREICTRDYGSANRNCVGYFLGVRRVKAVSDRMPTCTTVEGTKGSALSIRRRRSKRCLGVDNAVDHRKAATEERSSGRGGAGYPRHRTASGMIGVVTGLDTRSVAAADVSGQRRDRDWLKSRLRDTRRATRRWKREKAER